MGERRIAEKGGRDHFRSVLTDTFPEFTCYRDVCFYWKLWMMSEPLDQYVRVKPAGYTRDQARLLWRCDGDVDDTGKKESQPVFHIHAFCGRDAKGGVGVKEQVDVGDDDEHRRVSWHSKGISLLCRGSCWKSLSCVSAYHVDAVTEDDILHVQTLDTFKDVLSAADEELLLSFLTVPYMRIPLCLGFFAHQNHFQALQSTAIQELLDSVLFEPSRFLQPDSIGVPVSVPTRDEALLGTPCGLLLNEVICSPSSLLGPTTEILQQALTIAKRTPYQLRRGIIADNSPDY
eukprot:gene9644-biopygen3733